MDQGLFFTGLEAVNPSRRVRNFALSLVSKTLHLGPSCDEALSNHHLLQPSARHEITTFRLSSVVFRPLDLDGKEFKVIYK